MKIYIVVISLIVALEAVSALRMIQWPPAECKKCRSDQKCVRTNIRCFTTPCPQYKCVDKPTVKPGKCPNRFISRMSKRCGPYGCKSDSECPGDLKCCGWCFRKCTKPAHAPKPGKCPAEKPGRAGICIAKCTYDSECPGKQKCCGSCPRVCKAPASSSLCPVKCKRDEKCIRMVVLCKKRPCPTKYHCVNTKPKSGSCPTRKFPLISFNYCTYDSECRGTKKCCRRVCESPARPRPGRCPFYRTFDICRPFPKHRCSKDGDCKYPLKCCGHCVRTCTIPMVDTRVCPVSRRKCPYPYKPADRCSIHRGCLINQKCCRGVCGNMVCLIPWHLSK